MRNLLLTIIILMPVQTFANCLRNSLNKENLKKYNFVIVPGIFNEVIPYYMTEYRRYFLKAGVPANQILKINNATRKKPEEVIEEMYEKLSDLDLGKEIIFFAHSKGALETLYMLMQNSKKIKLKKAYLIQGALDGSSAYRLVVFGGKDNFFLKLGKFLRLLPYLNQYTKSFSFNFVREKLKGISTRENLLKKITFIESQQEYEKLALKFKFLGGLYKKAYDVSGDGVLLKKDHVPFELQTVDGICRLFYEADHGDLVKAAPWQKERVERIKYFLNELL